MTPEGRAMYGIFKFMALKWAVIIGVSWVLRRMLRDQKDGH